MGITLYPDAANEVKDLLKNALSISFVQKNLIEFFDINKWFDLLKLKTSTNNLKAYTNIQKRDQWTDNDLEKISSIFIQAFLENIDNLELCDDFLKEIAYGICECFQNYHHHNTFSQGFASVLSDILPVDSFGIALGSKNFFFYAAYTHEVDCSYTFYFSDSKKVVVDIGNESYVYERSLLSEEDWKGYFPDQDLDEVFGFKLEDYQEK